MLMIWVVLDDNDHNGNVADDNDNVVYHPFLRSRPRCIPHLVESVPVDKVPRTFWRLGEDLHSLLQVSLLFEAW